MIKGQRKIVDTSEFRSKEHAISSYLRHKHGDKRVAAAMGLKEDNPSVPSPNDKGSWRSETPWRKIKGTGSVTDKSGAQHTPMSRARHLAQMGLNKTKKEAVTTATTLEGK
jgi:hypothetical protein